MIHDNIWPIYNYLKIWNLRVQKINQNIEKIAFKVAQIKFLAMYITNQKWSCDIFTVGDLQNIFMEHDLNILMIFGTKEKSIILTHTIYGVIYNISLSVFGILFFYLFFWDCCYMSTMHNLFAHSSPVQSCLSYLNI